MTWTFDPVTGGEDLVLGPVRLEVRFQIDRTDLEDIGEHQWSVIVQGPRAYTDACDTEVASGVERDEDDAKTAALQWARQFIKAAAAALEVR